MPEYTDIGGAVATLRIIDEFTAPVKEALAQLAELQAALDRFRGAGAGLSAPFTRLSAAIARTEAPLSALADRVAAIGGEADIAITRFEGLSAPISGATDALAVASRRLATMQSEAAAIAAASADTARNYDRIGRARMPTLALGGGGGRGGGGEGGGPRIGGERPHRLAGTLLGISLPATLALGGAFVTYESFKAAMSENLALRQSTEAFNVTGKVQTRRDMRALQDLVRNASIGTIFTQAETARAMLAAAQMSGFTGQKGIEQFGSIFPVILRAAEVAQMQGLGSIGENIRAAMGFAHLTTAYSAAALAPALDEILAIAEHTRTTINSVESTMKYGLPMALAAGANVSQAAMLIGFLQRAGLQRTAGYAVGQMILGVLNTGGALNAHLVQARESVRKALGGRAERFRHMSAHQAALREMGILNAAGNLTILNKQGGVDLSKLIADIQAFALHHTAAELANAMHAAFGTRGMRGAVLLAEQRKLFEKFEKLITGTPSAVAQQAAFAQTPLQEFEQLGARLEDLGNELATDLLPALDKFLDVLVRIFNAVDNFVANPLSVLPRITIPTGAPVTPEPVHIGISTPEEVQRNSRLVQRQGSGLAGAIFRRATHGPIGTHGDPVFTHPLDRPEPHPPAPVTVNQDFHITVNGITDTLGITGLLNQWWGEHRGDVANAARAAVVQEQKHNARRSFVGPGAAHTP